MGRDKDWVRKDYEEFVKRVTSSWPEWKKTYASTRFVPESQHNLKESEEDQA